MNFTYFYAEIVDTLSETTNIAEKIYSRNDYGMSIM